MILLTDVSPFHQFFGNWIVQAGIFITAVASAGISIGLYFSAKEANKLAKEAIQMNFKLRIFDEQIKLVINIQEKVELIRDITHKLEATGRDPINYKVEDKQLLYRRTLDVLDILEAKSVFLQTDLTRIIFDQLKTIKVAFQDAEHSTIDTQSILRATSIISDSINDEIGVNKISDENIKFINQLKSDILQDK